MAGEILGLVNKDGGGAGVPDARVLIRQLAGRQNYYELDSANYTILDTDDYRFIYVTTGALDRTLTLPTVADNDKRSITVKKVDSGAGKVIIDGEGEETIDGFLTLSICAPFDAVTLQAVNGKWYKSVPELVAYAEMLQTDNAIATTINTIDVWEEIDNYVAGELCNITVANSDMTLGTGLTGKFIVGGQVSGVPGSANHVFEFAISVNDIIITKTKVTRKFSNTSDADTLPIRGILSLVDGDSLKVKVRNTSGTGNFTVHNSNITLLRIA